MINEGIITRLNKLSEMCENSIKTLDEHYLDLSEEINNIYVAINEILNSEKPIDNTKKANIVFDGENWRIDTCDDKSGLSGTSTYNTLIGYPANYVDDDIISQIEVLTSLGYKISFEYRIKGE